VLHKKQTINQANGSMNQKNYNVYNANVGAFVGARLV
jgi:hypothetical protein